jgi:hypothetical protein
MLISLLSTATIAQALRVCWLIYIREKECPWLQYSISFNNMNTNFFYLLSKQAEWHLGNEAKQHVTIQDKLISTFTELEFTILSAPEPSQQDHNASRQWVLMVGSCVRIFWLSLKLSLLVMKAMISHNPLGIVSAKLVGPIFILI